MIMEFTKSLLITHNTEGVSDWWLGTWLDGHVLLIKEAHIIASVIAIATDEKSDLAQDGSL